MKTLISLFVAAFLVVASVSADDAAIVANWKFPVGYWFPNGPLPAAGIDNVPRAQALADSIANFDPASANFDAVWSSLATQGTAGAGYPIANTTGNPNSDHGAADFTGAFKVLYDHDNIYVMLQYLDDNITQSEGVEIMWAPYFEIPEIAALASAISSTHPQQASHARYSQFGAYKVNFAYSGSFDATMVDFDASGVGSFKANSTNDVIANNIFFTSCTTPGSHTIKSIYTIGYQALTGNAYTVGNARPDFNTTIWKALNGGKGISFDIHVIDTDADDALNTATPPVVKPQEYWWNATNNEGWCETYYSGFLGVASTNTAVKQVYDNKSLVFGKVTSSQVELTKNADVDVFNTIGKCVMSLKNTEVVDLSNLNKGIYILKANNETLKFVR